MGGFLFHFCLSSCRLQSEGFQVHYRFDSAMRQSVFELLEYATDLIHRIAFHFGLVLFLLHFYHKILAFFFDLAYRFLNSFGFLLLEY